MKKDLFYTVVFTTLLALNPLMAAPVVSSEKTQLHSLSTKIASELISRGLDEAVANDKAHKLVGDAEGAFFYGLKNLALFCNVVDEKKIVSTLGMMALREKQFIPYRYSSLISFVQMMHAQALSKQTLEELEFVAMKNQLLQNYFLQVA